MIFDITAYAKEQAKYQSMLVETGVKIGEEHYQRLIRALDIAYRRALLDPETKVPSYLMATMLALIMTSPEANIKAENDYANAMVKRDQLARHEGRPEHDFSTDGRPLKGAP